MGYMRALREIAKQKGVPLTAYMDRHAPCAATIAEALSSRQPSPRRKTWQRSPITWAAPY